MPHVPPRVLRILPEVEGALRAGRPVVALESSVLAQGLPSPENRQAAERMLQAVTAAGAVPAITAVVEGIPTLGLESDELERFLAREGVAKVSARDLPWAMATRRDGATTVAAALAIAAAGGVCVFATGGIGGVHREPPFDESADLVELARSPVITVCSGAKSILDLHATWERLETLGVPVIGYRTTELPAFFGETSGIALAATTDSAAEIAEVFRAHTALRRSAALLVAQPPPAAVALSADELAAATTEALAEARQRGVRGSAVTPFLLSSIERRTGGRSLVVNLALLERNAALAAEIAVELHARMSADERRAGAPTASVIASRLGRGERTRR